MGRSTYRTAETIVLRAVELEAASRDAYLDRACGDDPVLRREVQSLLAADASACGFLERPALGAGDDLPAPGDVLGHYRVVERLGAGGMGVVYRGERADGLFEKTVAIKFLRSRALGPVSIETFRVERQILASLEHPNIARLLDGGTTAAGRPYLVMEAVEGEPIDAFARRRTLTIDARVDLVSKVCKAVHHAHRSLVIHRDLKPQNILITDEGEPKLIDFGLARFAQVGEVGVEGGALGTRGYASPEQVAGERVTTASDVYALGVVLHELLTDRLPDACDGEASPPPRHPVGPDSIASDATPPSRVVADPRVARRLRGDLDAIMLRAVACDPSARYESVEALGRDLLRHRRDLPVAARAHSRRYVVGRFLRRHATPVALAGLLALVVAAFAATASLQAHRLRIERDGAFRSLQQSREVTELLTSIFEASDVEEARAGGPRPGETSARELLDRGAERILGDEFLAAEVRAELLQALGIAYRNEGAWDRAQTLLDEALHLRRRATPAAPEAVASVLVSLGRLAAERGDLEVARARTRAAVSLLRTHQAGPARLANGLNGLGEISRQLDAFDEAEQAHREALAIRQSLFAPDAYEVRESHGNLGLVYAAQRDLERANLHVSASLLMDASSSPTGRTYTHLADAVWMSNLAQIRDGLGQSDDATHLIEASLAIRRALLPAGHPGLVMGLNNLAARRLRDGGLDQAHALLDEALTTGLPQLGAAHPNLAMCRYNLARIATQRRDFEEARAQLTLGMEAFRASWGENHSAVLKGHHRLAALFEAEGRDREAEHHYAQAAEGQRAIYGGDHPATVASLWGLGRARLARGRPAAAIEPLRQAHDVLIRTDPEAAARLAADLEAARIQADL